MEFGKYMTEGIIIALITAMASIIVAVIKCFRKNDKNVTNISQNAKNGNNVQIGIQKNYNSDKEKK